jgi:hypothetical protein
MHDKSCGDENACYSGYCVTLVRELSEMLGFTYNFVPVRPGILYIYRAASKQL